MFHYCMSLLYEQCTYIYMVSFTDDADTTLVILNCISAVLFICSEYIGQSRCKASGVIEYFLLGCLPTLKPPDEDETELKTIAIV